MADVLKKVPVREQDPKVRATNFEEVCYGYNQEEAMEEGCISLPGIHETVKRGNRIHVKYMDENFVEHDEVVEGYLARVMQHEFDHLDGKIFIDHISPLRKQMIKGKLNTMLKGKARSSYKMKQIK